MPIPVVLACSLAWASQVMPPRLYDVTTVTAMPHLEENLRYATTHEKRCLTQADLSSASAFPVLGHAALKGCRLGEESWQEDGVVVCPDLRRRAWNDWRRTLADRRAADYRHAQRETGWQELHVLPACDRPAAWGVFGRIDSRSIAGSDAQPGIWRSLGAMALTSAAFRCGHGRVPAARVLGQCISF